MKMDIHTLTIIDKNGMPLGHVIDVIRNGLADASEAKAALDQAWHAREDHHCDHVTAFATSFDQERKEASEKLTIMRDEKDADITKRDGEISRLKEIIDNAGGEIALCDKERAKRIAQLQSELRILTGDQQVQDFKTEEQNNGG